MALEVVTSALICSKNDDITRISVPAAALSLVAGLALLMLSHFEHMRSHRPSFLIGLYLLINLLLRATMVRTYWHIGGYRSVASATLASILVQLVVLGLESYNKSHLVGEKETSVSAEGSAGFLARSLFIWLNPLFVTGYRRSLTADDLQLIDESLASKNVANGFHRLQSTPTCKKGPYMVCEETLTMLSRDFWAPCSCIEMHRNVSTHSSYSPPSPVRVYLCSAICGVSTDRIPRRTRVDVCRSRLWSHRRRIPCLCWNCSEFRPGTFQSNDTVLILARSRTAGTGIYPTR